MTKKLFIKLTVITSFILSMMVGVIYAADSVVLDGYLIEFLGYEMNGTQGTFTYAVTANTELYPISNGLSHWTIGLGNCSGLDLAGPIENDTYQTGTGYPVCSSNTYSCLAANYPQVEFGPDGTTGVTTDAIKFGDANDEQLSQENLGTHIFQFTIDNVTGTQDVQVGVKTGSGSFLGAITGPLCNTPSAVTLSASQAGAAPSTSGWFILLTLALTSATGLYFWRRELA